MARLKKLTDPSNSIEVEEVQAQEETALKTLQETIKRYFLNKSEFDSYKKLVDKDNKAIKEIMLENEVAEFEVDDIVAKCSVSERESFNEDLLLQIIKKESKRLKLKGIVKKKEYVDADALESAIYNGDIDAAVLAPAREIKEVVTLKVSRKKQRS